MTTKHPKFNYPGGKTLPPHQALEIEKIWQMAQKYSTPWGYSFFQYEITKPIAEAIIAHTKLFDRYKNRHETPNHIARISRQQTQKRWENASVDPFYFSPDVELGGGYHRCYSILDNGLPMTVDIKVFSDFAAFESARDGDGHGKVRTKGNALEIAGIVPEGQGRRGESILSAASLVDKEWPADLTSAEMRDMGRAYKTSLNRVLEDLPVTTYHASLSAAFMIAHRKAPKEIAEAMKLLTDNYGFASGSAVHKLSLRILRDKDALREREEKHQCIQLTLALLYKHVKNTKKLGKYVQVSKPANEFFLGDHFREMRKSKNKKGQRDE